MIININLVSTILLGAMLSFTQGRIHKTRLCIQYEIDDYVSSKNPLKQISGLTKGNCLMECVRHQQGSSPCRAFHFRQREATCELLPEERTCMSETTSPGTTYVHLSDCQSGAPWRRLNTSPGSWQWVTNPASLSDTVNLRSPLGAVRYVGRVLHKGMWLPAWIQYSRANFAGVDGVTFKCKNAIQYLTFSDPAHYRWDSFLVGEPVPSAAVVAGYWPSGAPLYIIRLATNPHSSIFFAYYDAESSAIRPQFTQMQPTSLGILVSTL